MLYVFRDYKVLAFIVRDFWKLPHEEIKITHKSFIDIKKKKDLLITRILICLKKLSTSLC